MKIKIVMALATLLASCSTSMQISLPPMQVEGRDIIFRHSTQYALAASQWQEVEDGMHDPIIFINRDEFVRVPQIKQWDSLFHEQCHLEFNWSGVVHGEKEAECCAIEKLHMHGFLTEDLLLQLINYHIDIGHWESASNILSCGVQYL